MKQTCSDALLKKTNLLTECANTYAYAVEVVESGSHMSEEICRSCAEVCRNCAEECLQLEEDPLGDDLYQFCLQYAALCEKILSYKKEEPLKDLKQSI